MTDIGIFDLEWTAWEGSVERRWQGPGEAKEIVQIGAVRLADTREFEELAVLDVLVKPRRNPVLSEYFKDLTGIAQRQIDETRTTYVDALEDLQALFDGVTRIWSFGEDQKVLALNCDMNDITMPFNMALFANARLVVAELIGANSTTLESGALPNVMGFPRPGGAHDALGDSRCIAEAFRILRRQGKF